MRPRDETAGRDGLSPRTARTARSIASAASCRVGDLSVGPARTEAAPARSQPVTTTPRPTTTTTSTAADWYEGGTLHKANAQQWRAGSARDRLATAADWATVSLGRDKVRALGSIDRLRPYAEEIVWCADEAVADRRIVNVAMSGIAATCWLLVYGD